MTEQSEISSGRTAPARPTRSRAALYNRVLHVAHALDPRRTFECPPACDEGHTYRWPCGQTINEGRARRKVGGHSPNHPVNIAHLRPPSDGAAP